MNFKAPKIKVISFCVSFRTNVCTVLLWDFIRLETKEWIHFLDKLGTKQSGGFSNAFLSKKIVTFILYWCEHDSSTARNITDASAKFANIYIFAWPNIDRIKHFSHKYNFKAYSELWRPFEFWTWKNNPLLQHLFMNLFMAPEFCHSVVFKLRRTKTPYSMRPSIYIYIFFY